MASFMKTFTAIAFVTGSMLAMNSHAIAASPPNMLVIGTDLSRIRTLDPSTNNNRPSSEILCNLYDTLVQTGQDDLSVIRPMLATSWVISDDRRTITFTLRTDAKFSSGNPLTAEDAAWSIQRVIKMGQVGSADLAVTGLNADNVEKLVTAKDARTLVIQLPQEISPTYVLHSLASSSIGVIDKKTALSHERNGDFGSTWLNSNSAGSGPFALADWRPNDIALFNVRKDYWGGSPAMDRVAIRHIPESGNLRLQLESGDLDIAQYLNSGDLEALENNKNVTIQNVPGFGYYFIGLNLKDPDLQKPLVREAFQHIFNWKAVAGNLMRYSGYPWQSVIPKGMPGAPSDAEAVSRQDYDPAKAKALLAQAGYPNGIKKKLYPVGPVLPVALALQSQAKAAGVEFEVVPGQWTPAFRSRDFEVVLSDSGAKVADPFSVATLMAYNPDNSDEAKLASYDLWRSAQFEPPLNKLVEESGKETDPAKRESLFRQIDQYYAAMKTSLIIFFQRTDVFVVQNKVKGYQGQSTWSTRWSQVVKQ